MLIAQQLVIVVKLIYLSAFNTVCFYHSVFLSVSQCNALGAVMAVPGVGLYRCY